MKGKLDSLFYGKIAECKSKDGSKFWVDTCGEITMTYKGEQHTGGDLGGKIDRLNLTDKIIGNECEFDQSNWFEVNTDADFDLGDGFIGDDYDDAIRVLKLAVKDYEMECKENEEDEE